MKSIPLIIAAASAALFTVIPSSANAAAPDASGKPFNSWAGRGVVARPGVQISSVAASFTVPKTACTATDAEAGFWVGLDGWTDATVEQAGAIAFCGIRTRSGYKPEYFVFYEMFPKFPVLKHHVSAGDVIVASVSYNSSSGKYFLEVDDKTHPGDSFSASASCPSGHTCRRNSAEVIAEDPGSGGPAKHHFLPNFGTVHFSQVEVISRSGAIGSLKGNSLWSAKESIMEYPGKTVMARPSRRTSGYTAFNVTYHSKG